MDILRLQYTSVGDQDVVHEEFLEQLKRDPKEGWYESGLPWKGDHRPLASNEANSLKRLGSLVQRLKKTERLDEYDAIIQDQLKEGIVERVTEPPSKPVFYFPHHPVNRESAESTKMRIVCDASSKLCLTSTYPLGPPRCSEISLAGGQKSSTYVYATIHPSTVWNGSISVPVGSSVTVSSEC